MPTFSIVWSSLIGLFASCSLPANSQDPGVQYTISIARRAKVWMHVVATKECCLTTDGRLAAFGEAVAGPDGAVYVVMDEPGAILQVSIQSK